MRARGSAAGGVRAMSMIYKSSSSLKGWTPLRRSTASIPRFSCRKPTSEIMPRPTEVAGNPRLRRGQANESRVELAAQ